MDTAVSFQQDRFAGNLQKSQKYGNRCDLDRLELQHKSILTVRKKLPDDLYGDGTRKKSFLQVLSLLAFIDPTLSGYHDSWGRLLDTMLRITATPLSTRQLTRYLKEFEGIYLTTSRSTYRKYKKITFLPKLRELYRHDRVGNPNQNIDYSILHQTSKDEVLPMSVNTPHQTKRPSVPLDSPKNERSNNNEMTRVTNDDRTNNNRATKTQNLKKPTEKPYQNQITSILEILTTLLPQSKQSKKTLNFVRSQLYDPQTQRKLKTQKRTKFYNYTEWSDELPWGKWLRDWFEYTWIQRRQIAKDEIIPCLKTQRVHMPTQKIQKSKPKNTPQPPTFLTIDEQRKKADETNDTNLKWLTEVAAKCMKLEKRFT